MTRGGIQQPELLPHTTQEYTLSSHHHPDPQLLLHPAKRQIHCARFLFRDRTAVPSVRLRPRSYHNSLKHTLMRKLINLAKRAACLGCCMRKIRCSGKIPVCST